VANFANASVPPPARLYRIKLSSTEVGPATCSSHGEIPRQKQWLKSVAQLIGNVFILSATWFSNRACQ